MRRRLAKVGAVGVALGATYLYTRRQHDQDVEVPQKLTDLADGMPQGPSSPAEYVGDSEPEPDPAEEPDDSDDSDDEYVGDGGEKAKAEVVEEYRSQLPEDRMWTQAVKQDENGDYYNPAKYRWIKENLL